MEKDIKNAPDVFRDSQGILLFLRENIELKGRMDLMLGVEV